MTTIDTHAESVATASVVPAGTGRVLSGVASWITTADHKRIGRLFVGFSTLFLLGVAGVGALLGFERIDTDSIALDAGSLGQLFSLFRVGFVFFVMTPLMLGVAIAVVPLQIGSKSLTFPRAAALGLWTWLTGSGLVIAAYATNGGPGGGDESGVDLFLAGLGLTVIGLIIAAASLAATVLTSRAPGMYLDRVPMFAWSAFVGAIALLVTLPVLLAALIYLFADHRFGARTSLDENGWGGNTGVHTWIRFAITQPQTYVYAIPVLGFVAEVVPVFARRRMVIRRAALIGVGVLATAGLAGISQTDHGIGPWRPLGDFDKVQDIIPYAFFNLLPIAGILAVMGACMLTLRPALKARQFTLGAPLLFGLGAAGMLTLGTLAHTLTPIADLQLAGTVYEEGEFTLVAYAVVLAAMGAITYWGPKLWGRRLPKVPTLLMALGGTGATVLASVPYLLAGLNNQPGIFGVTDATQLVSGFDNDVAPALMNTLVALGHALMVLTVLGFAMLALRSFTKGERSGDDPWDGQTLEWMTSSPPPLNNFAETPTVASAEPLADLKPSRSDA